jgi:hypothetical protein
MKGFLKLLNCKFVARIKEWWREREGEREGEGVSETVQ